MTTDYCHCYTITGQQCHRRKTIGDFCTQHARLECQQTIDQEPNRPLDVHFVLGGQIGLVTSTWSDFSINDQIITYKQIPLKGICRKKTPQRSIPLYVAQEVTNFQSTGSPHPAELRSIHHWMILDHDQIKPINLKDYPQILRAYQISQIDWKAEHQVLKRLRAFGFYDCQLPHTQMEIDTILNEVYAPNWQVTKAVNLLEQLNRRLQEICTNQGTTSQREGIIGSPPHFVFDYIHHFPKHVILGSEEEHSLSPISYVIALKTSSIQGIYRSTVTLTAHYLRDLSGLTINIKSLTVPQYERRGYNKLLRCVAIMMAYHLTGFSPDGKQLLPVKQMTSNAVNPISAYVLSKDFHWNIDLEKNHPHLLTFSQLPRDYNDFKEWFNIRSEGIGIDLSVDLTPEYRRFIMELFEIILQQLVTKTGGTC